MKIFRALPLAAVLIGSLLLGVTSSAEQLPSRTRGLTADSVYQNGDLGHINLFNGNLSLTIPIGPSYPVSPQLSYRLALIYNSSVWDYDDELSCLDSTGVNHEFNFPYPAASSNAGVGWSLHLGRLYAPNDTVYNRHNNHWLYVSPDGGQHNFYDKLHPTESVVSGVFYTLDGTYLRLDVRDPTKLILESPDGTRHKFEQNLGRYRLAEMQDRFANWLKVAYGATTWTVTDSQGRSHTLTLNASGQITQVTLAAFGATTAIYGLSYTTESLERHRFDRPCTTLDPSYTESVSAQMLSTLQLPDNSTFAFSYDITDGPGAFSGAIREAVMPTGGRIEWDYTTYTFRTQGPAPQPSPQPSARNQQRGVGARRTYLASSGGTLDGSWSYDYVESIAVIPPSGPFIPSCWHRMRVSDNLSQQVTESYFATAQGSDSWWYGLPYAPCDPDTLATTITPWSASNSNPYLSTRVYERQSNGTLTPIRSTYVIYDSDGRDAGNHQDRNHRVRYQKVVYHDDLAGSTPHQEETIHADFDGLGHYRSTSRTSSFGPAKTLATTYLPNGSFQLNPDNSSVITDSFTVPPISSPWVFGLSGGTTTTQGSLVSKSETCFDSETGFLKRQRMLAGSSQQTKDVVVAFEEGEDADGNDGFVVAQRIYGGDRLNNATTGALCDLSLSSPEAAKRNSYQYGRLTRGAWVEPCDENQEILVTEEAEIDPATGLPSSVTETNGLIVDLSYDAMGRLLAEVPTEGASRTHQYEISPPSYEIRHCPQGNDQFCNVSQRLSDRYWAYDGLGRMKQKALAYPGPSGSDTDSSVTFKIDGIGRKTEESTWGGAHKTVFGNFDVFGRARNIAPEGTYETKLTFRGERIRGREVKIATGIDSVQSVFTTEEHDHHGRLVAVCEAATAIWGGGSETCSGQLTRYGYDQDDRLIKVCQNVGPGGLCGQERLFGWDGRGFLVAEKHPEIGAGGNGVLSYQRDARGNMTSRDISNDGGDRPLRFTYDGAGRNIKVEEQVSSGFRVLKEFFYARKNLPGSNEKRRGQLVMARRTNWVAGIEPLLIEGGVPLAVTDHYQYFGLGGRVSKKTTSISLPSGGQSFSSEYTYGPLGDVATLEYPTGDWPHESAPQRTVSYNRRLGFLTDMPGYASAITYQLGGMLYEIHHQNGVIWRQNAEAATGWERPDQIEAFKPGNPLWSTGDYSYDGAGNISAIGNRKYVYDAFSRFSFVRNNNVTPYEQVATYDAYGNLTSLTKSGATRALNADVATNRLTIPGIGYTSNGEVKAATIDGAAFAYDYDGLGQQLFQQSATKTWLYVYDANDERVLNWECALSLCGEETTFERYTPRGLSGEVLRTFEGKYRGSLEWKEDYVYRDGRPLAWIKAPPEGGSEIHQYLHADHLGSTRLVTSATGAQVARHDFLPFGEESTAVTAGDVDLKFTGHERDQPGKPHDYMKARFFSPLLGRFQRPDPVLQIKRSTHVPQMWNRYSYAANNPLKFVDPTGRVVELPSSCGDSTSVCKELANLRNTVPPVLRNFVRSTVVNGTTVVDTRFLNMMKGASSGNFQALRQVANSPDVAMFRSSLTEVTSKLGTEAIGAGQATSGITFSASQSLSGKIEIYTGGNLGARESAATTAHEFRHGRRLIHGMQFLHELKSTMISGPGGDELEISFDPNGPVNLETAAAEAEAMATYDPFIPQNQ